MTTEAFYLGVDLLGVIVLAASLPLIRDETMCEEPTETLEQRVHAMLDDAVANEYDITAWPADDIVADLLAYADVVETAEELHPHVITWKIKNGALI